MSADLNGSADKGMSTESSRRVERLWWPLDDTVARRISRYKTSVKRCAFVGAGFGGLLLVLGPGTLIAHAPGFFSPVILTVVVFGAGFVGWAYISFLMGRADLEADVEDGTVARSDLAQETNRYSRAIHFSYLAALLALAVASALTVLAAWLSVDVS